MYSTQFKSLFCDIYNIAGIIDVDAARLQLFINTYTVSDVNEEFNWKNFDTNNKTELLQEFR